MSFVSLQGHFFYYRRLPVDLTALGSLSNTTVRGNLTDRVLQCFPPTLSFKTNDNISLEFSMQLASALEHYAVCIFLKFHVDCDDRCHSVVNSWTIYSDWNAGDVNKSDFVFVSKQVTNFDVWTVVNVSIAIHAAITDHEGQYICSLFTEPSAEGPSIHSQTKVVSQNKTRLLPPGFMTAQMTVCGLVSVNTEDDSVATIPAGRDNCLVCYASASDAMITFSKDEIPLQMTSSNSLAETSGDPDFRAVTYILRGPTSTDSGIYTCHVDSISGTAQDSIHLTIS